MYLLNPAHGRRRRALLPDKLSAGAVGGSRGSVITMSAVGATLAGQEDFPDEQEAPTQNPGRALNYKQ
jgi:hypothetical protein